MIFCGGPSRLSHVIDHSFPDAPLPTLPKSPHTQAPPRSVSYYSFCAVRAKTSIPHTCAVHATLSNATRTRGARHCTKGNSQTGEGSRKVYLVQRSDGQAGGKTFVMKEVQLLPTRHEMEARKKRSQAAQAAPPAHRGDRRGTVAEETLCIVMEYADGKDLDTLIKQRKQQRKPSPRRRCSRSSGSSRRRWRTATTTTTCCTAT